jgi:putative transposon-encoded protein
MLSHGLKVVTPSGNSGHVVVPKAWIGKEAIVTFKQKENKNKGRS